MGGARLPLDVDQVRLSFLFLLPSHASPAPSLLSAYMTSRRTIRAYNWHL